MAFVLVFFVGAIFGAALGIGIYAAVVAGVMADERAGREYRELEY